MIIKYHEVEIKNAGGKCRWKHNNHYGSVIIAKRAFFDSLWTNWIFSSLLKRSYIHLKEMFEIWAHIFSYIFKNAYIEIWYLLIVNWIFIVTYTCSFKNKYFNNTIVPRRKQITWNILRMHIASTGYICTLLWISLQNWSSRFLPIATACTSNFSCNCKEGRMQIDVLRSCIWEVRFLWVNLLQPSTQE